MKLARIAPLLLAAVALAVSACKSPSPPAPAPRTSSAEGATAARASQTRRPRPATDAQPGDFDFYLLNLSWSPEFCATHPGNPQCAARPGFLVHGLWPQNNDGSYPENCNGMPRPANPAAYLDIMPTVSLITHEWSTHGTCTGLNPDGYFAQIRQAFRSVAIPSTFAVTQSPPASIAPGILIAQFAAVNPAFPPGAFALSCGNNYLTAVEACFDKNLVPRACGAVRSCRANIIRIAPR